MDHHNRAAQDETTGPKGGRAAQGVCDLSLVARGLAFPAAVLPPLACAARGARVHVVARDAGQRGALHVALDRAGQTVAPARRLPLSYVAGVTAWAEGTVVTGAALAGDRPVALGLDADGGVQWQIDVPVEGRLALWPRPASEGDDRVWLAWATGGETSTIQVARVEPAALRPARTLACDDPTEALAVAAAAGGLTLARVHGAPSRLEVARVVEGAAVWREDLTAARDVFAPSLAVVAGGYAVLWISRTDGNLRLARLDDDARPSGSAQTPVTPPAGERLRSARLAGVASDCLAMTWQTATGGDDVVVRDDDGAPVARRHTQNITQFVGAYTVAQAMGTIHQVEDPGIFYDAGAWLAGVLLLLHGGSAPRISIYQSARR